MQHTEFFDRDHFAKRYLRQKARRPLSEFIDFFWETDFESLFDAHPDGFSDALFPNVGYTYMLNLGSPFVMQLAATKFDVKHDIFLPRQQHMICHHSAGNKIFGIKFKVSPVALEKNVNFSEYRAAVHPLSYLIDKSIVQQVKAAPNFEARIRTVSGYYLRIIEEHAEARRPVALVTGMLREASDRLRFNTPVAELAEAAGVSPRTLQRYFLATTGIATKQALQILRIRKAVELLVTDPGKFRFEDFGYYDYSHFYKHLRSFLDGHHLDVMKPHLTLLRQ